MAVGEWSHLKAHYILIQHVFGLLWKFQFFVDVLLQRGSGSEIMLLIKKAHFQWWQKNSFDPFHQFLLTAFLCCVVHWPGKAWDRWETQLRLAPLYLQPTVLRFTLMGWKAFLHFTDRRGWFKAVLIPLILTRQSLRLLGNPMCPTVSGATFMRSIALSTGMERNTCVLLAVKLALHSKPLTVFLQAFREWKACCLINCISALKFHAR